LWSRTPHSIPYFAGKYNTIYSADKAQIRLLPQVWKSGKLLR